MGTGERQWVFSHSIPRLAREEADFQVSLVTYICKAYFSAGKACDSDTQAICLPGIPPLPSPTNTRIFLFQAIFWHTTFAARKHSLLGTQTLFKRRFSSHLRNYMAVSAKSRLMLTLAVNVSSKHCNTTAHCTRMSKKVKRTALMECLRCIRIGRDFCPDN